MLCLWVNGEGWGQHLATTGVKKFSIEFQVWVLDLKIINDYVDIGGASSRRRKVTAYW